MSAEPASRPLSQLFRQAQAVYNEIDGSELSGSDAGLQRRVIEGLAVVDAALARVVSMSIFSPNEVLDDINTVDAKYLLLPLYRAELLLKRNEPEDRRLPLLREALACLRGFLADLDRLEALSPEAKVGWENASGRQQADAGAARTQKIARLKASKAARERIQVITAKMSGAKKRAASAGSGDDDDDVEELEREHVLLLLWCASLLALDSERAAAQELEMLEQIAKMRRPDGSLPKPPAETESEEARKRFRTLTLLPQSAARTGDPQRDPSSRLSYATAMRQIHTGEIPGLYTFSVEEGLRQEEAERAMAEAARMEEMATRAEGRRQKEEQAEEAGEDDDDKLQRARAMDEWKDMHKRGYGNRKNRS